MTMRNNNRHTKKCNKGTTGDLEVADSTPTRSATFFRGNNHEIFSTVILSLTLIQDGQLSVSGIRMCTILVNRLED